MSLTVPRWPGSLYSSFFESTSHTATLPSALPAPILLPFGAQLARIKFFSIPAGAPSYLAYRVINCMQALHRGSYMLICLLAGANVRISQVRTVLSIELDRRDCPSGEIPSEVTVSWWPCRVYTIARLRTSHTYCSSDVIRTEIRAEVYLDVILYTTAKYLVSSLAYGHRCHREEGLEIFN